MRGSFLRLLFLFSFFALIFSVPSFAQTSCDNGYQPPSRVIHNLQDENIKKAASDLMKGLIIKYRDELNDPDKQMETVRLIHGRVMGLFLEIMAHFKKHPGENLNVQFDCLLGSSGVSALTTTPPSGDYSEAILVAYGVEEGEGDRGRWERFRQGPVVDPNPPQPPSLIDRFYLEEEPSPFAMYITNIETSSLFIDNLPSLTSATVWYPASLPLPLPGGGSGGRPDGEFDYDIDWLQTKVILNWESGHTHYELIIDPQFDLFQMEYDGTVCTLNISF